MVTSSEVAATAGLIPPAMVVGGAHFFIYETIACDAGWKSMAVRCAQARAGIVGRPIPIEERDVDFLFAGPYKVCSPVCLFKKKT